MIALLFCTHIVMTKRTGFIQRRTLKAIRLSLKSGGGGEGELSPFAALSTTLAATLGTGNIIGVGTAIVLGGAGAVFWCWVTGLFGMATQYGEVFLSVRFRVKDSEGNFTGGPMYVLRDGVKSKRLALLYAVLSAGAVHITGSVVQSNAVCAVVAEVFEGKVSCFEISGNRVSVLEVVTATLLGILTLITVFSSISAVGSICQVMVPFMGAVYILGTLLILLINRSVLGEAIALILREAFSLRAAKGGFFASGLMLSMRYGVARGLFSNESGLGTSAIVCASSKEVNPVRQGLVNMTATFWDTVVMCAVTGIALVSSLLSFGDGAFQNGIEGEALCYLAFSQIPFAGKGILVFSLCVFAFSTIAGLSCVGAKCAGFFLGSKGVRAYLVLWTSGVFLSPFIPLTELWDVADILNALLIIPNVYALIKLSGLIKSETKKYLSEN